MSKLSNNVEIAKSKNELFQISYILIYLGTFKSFWPSDLFILAESSLRISPGQVQNDQTFGVSLVSVKSIEKVTSTQEQVQKYCNWRKETVFRL